MVTPALRWHRAAHGALRSSDGRWSIRGPIFGAPMFWLYRDGSRYTPTGRFEDAVHFATAADARRFVSTLTGKA